MHSKNNISNPFRISPILTILIVLSIVANILVIGSTFGHTAYASTTSEVSNGSGMTGAGVCICFDDEYVDQWHTNARPLLQKYNARATFFLDSFDMFTNTQYQWLADLQSDGDEMACHGYRHLDAIAYLQNHTMDEYIAADITPAIAAMDAKGMHPTDFAYPYGSYNDSTNTALLAYFDHVRIISDYNDPASPNDPSVPPAWYRFNHERVVGAIGMDNAFNIPLQLYYGLMDSVMANNSVIIFYGHNTTESTTNDYITPPSRLEAILQYASDHHLKFYTMRDLQTPDPAPIPTSTLIDLNANWTLMSLPILNTTLMASDLGKVGARRVAAYNNITNSYDLSVIGYGSTDMQVLPDEAYFVDSASSTSFVLYGTIEGPHDVTLYPGWNAVGWRNLTTVKASDLGNRLSDIQRICRYNASTESYNTYVIGYSSGDADFNVRPGEGYFVYLNSTAPEQLRIGGI